MLAQANLALVCRNDCFFSAFLFAETIAFRNLLAISQFPAKSRRTVNRIADYRLKSAGIVENSIRKAKNRVRSLTKL